MKQYFGMKTVVPFIVLILGTLVVICYFRATLNSESEPGIQCGHWSIYRKWGIRFAPPMLNWADGVDSTGGFSFNLPRFCANVP